MVTSVPPTRLVEIADKCLLDHRAQEALGVVSLDSILNPAGIGATDETAGLQDVEASPRTSLSIIAARMKPNTIESRLPTPSTIMFFNETSHAPSWNRR